MFKSLLTLTTLLVCSIANAANYDIDIPGQHAFVTFKAKHLGFSYIVGSFESFDGSFSYDPADPSSSTVNATIEVSSLNTNHAERDKHLKSEEFFNVSEFPQITFQSTKFDGSAEGGKLTGTLSLRGVTKEVVLDIVRIGEGKDPWGGYRSGFEGTLSLGAGDYGFPAWVGDVDIELIIEGIRQ